MTQSVCSHQGVCADVVVIGIETSSMCSSRVQCVPGQFVLVLYRRGKPCSPPTLSPHVRSTRAATSGACKGLSDDHLCPRCGTGGGSSPMCASTAHPRSTRAATSGCGMRQPCSEAGCGLVVPVAEVAASWFSGVRAPVQIDSGTRRWPGEWLELQAGGSPVGRPFCEGGSVPVRPGAG